MIFIVVEKGKIIHQGSFEEIKDEDYFKIILQQQKEAEISEENSEESKENSRKKKNAKTKPKNGAKKNHLSKRGTKMTVDENKESVKVGWRVYLSYIAFTKTTLILFTISVLGLIARRFSKMFFDYTLLNWVKSIADTHQNDNRLFAELLISTFTTTIITAASALILIWFSLSVSVYVFREMLAKVCNAPVNLYFDVTPTGLILNRFSKDINMLDTTIPFSIRAQIMNYLIVISTIGITAYNVIWILLTVPFLLGILFWMMKIFASTLKESSRMESVTSSPVLTHLAETINGASAIRTFEKQDVFEQKQFHLLDQRVSAMIIKRGAQSWFNTRINLLAAFLMCFSYLY